MIIMCGCGNIQESTESEESEKPHIEYRFASESEAKDYLLSNDEYYSGFSQNEIEFKMQKKDADLEEYRAFAGEQVREFTEEEKSLIDDCLSAMEAELDEKGYTIPPLDEIVFIKTTMDEEPGAGGYTHGTQIYMSESILERYLDNPEDEKIRDYLSRFFWHELFHCLTRCNPDFRTEMYKLIHFTVQEDDFPLPPSVSEYHISNPDVEHHNSYATFHIGGQDIDCFTDFVTTKHFDTEGETFFDCSTTALVPIDGTDTYYTPEQADNFDEIFGTNTGYVVDPEECMADNFSYAMCYGMDGPQGKGYPDPEIVEGILDYLSN